MSNSYNLELTQKELEIARELVAGYHNYEIAKKFGLSDSAVKGRISRIFRKIGASNRPNAAFLLYKFLK